MKKSLKPFAVELRRTGKKLVSLPAKPLPKKSHQPAAQKRPALEPALAVEPVSISAPVLWPEIDDTPVSEARRAADAMFKKARPAEPMRAVEESVEKTDTRRVLPSLVEPDYIARMLQEEEARRPKRGRKPGAGLPKVRRIVPRDVQPPAKPMVLPVLLQNMPTKIKGYVRGRIYARYVRKTEPGLGQYWRKRLTPAW